MDNLQAYVHEKLRAFGESNAYDACVPKSLKESGRRLKAARLSSGFSLRELSERIGDTLSGSRISNYEQGTRRMTPEIATLLANALGISPLHLLCMDSHKGEEMTPEEIRLLRAFRALSEVDRERELIHLEVMALPHRKPAPERRVKAYADPARRPKSKRPIPS